jgi:hypothetical protein
LELSPFFILEKGDNSNIKREITPILKKGDTTPI